jgi:uncharacterized protein (DUF952 family)
MLLGTVVADTLPPFPRPVKTLPTPHPVFRDLARCTAIVLTACARACISVAMLIYKIFRASEWADLQAKGETAGAPVDLADGFIHFSTAAQARETARRHFAGEADLILAAIRSDDLGAALKWEPSRGGALFPHLYAPLPHDAVAWTAPLPLVDGAHVFPDAMA